jgi:hypothetical protein
MILDGQIPITTRVGVRPRQLQKNRPQRYSVAVFQKCGAGEDLEDVVAAAAGR